MNLDQATQALTKTLNKGSLRASKTISNAGFLPRIAAKASDRTPQGLAFPGSPTQQLRRNLVSNVDHAYK